MNVKEPIQHIATVFGFLILLSTKSFSFLQQEGIEAEKVLE